MATRRIKRIHIAILDCDVPMPTVYAARGLYSSQFRHLLQKAAERINSASSFDNISDHPHIEIHTTAYDVVGGSFPPVQILRRAEAVTPTGGRRGSEDGENSDYHNENPVLFPGPVNAILITGSAASAYEVDKYPWIRPLQSFVQTVFQDFPAVKIFGSCFGHQLVAQALLSDNPFEAPAAGDGDNDEREKKTISIATEACPDGFEIGIHPIRMNPEFLDQFPISRSSLPSPSSSFSSMPITGEEKEMRIQLIHQDRVFSRVRVRPDSSSSSPFVIPTDTNNKNENYKKNNDNINKNNATNKPNNLSLSSWHNDQHQQHCLQDQLLPYPWINVGSTAKSPIQGLYLPNRVLTYQGHFEFDTWVNRETLIEFARRYHLDELVVQGYLEDISRGLPWTRPSLTAEGAVRPSFSSQASENMDANLNTDKDPDGSAFNHDGAREEKEEEEEDDDDSKVAAEAVVLFLAGLPGDISVSPLTELASTTTVTTATTTTTTPATPKIRSTTVVPPGVETAAAAVLHNGLMTPPP
jgi:GMP synthase-like glutamine amidotransferase